MYINIYTYTYMTKEVDHTERKVQRRVYIYIHIYARTYTRIYINIHTYAGVYKYITKGVDDAKRGEQRHNARRQKFNGNAYD